MKRSNLFDPQTFWRDKILRWENDRYKQDFPHSSVLEKVASQANNSLAFRLEMAARILSPIVRGRRVLELGCGSSMLSLPLIKAGAISYRGVDFAETAITLAIEKAQLGGYEDKVSYRVADVTQVDDFEPDITFSLGLFDWLSTEQIEAVFALGGEHFLHSISEKRRSPACLLHQIYVFLAYGYRTSGYRPQYQSVTQITDIADLHVGRPINILRHRKLSFGTLLTTLKVPEMHVVNDD
jgi:cyclopropane fatty-acyl-phospholipid synthase-like methyltransferase